MTETWRDRLNDIWDDAFTQGEDPQKVIEKFIEEELERQAYKTIRDTLERLTQIDLPDDSEYWRRLGEILNPKS